MQRKIKSLEFDTQYMKQKLLIDDIFHTINEFYDKIKKLNNRELHKYIKENEISFSSIQKLIIKIMPYNKEIKINELILSFFDDINKNENDFRINILSNPNILSYINSLKNIIIALPNPLHLDIEINKENKNCANVHLSPLPLKNPNKLSINSFYSSPITSKKILSPITLKSENFNL